MTFIFFITTASQKTFYGIKTTFYDKNRMSQKAILLVVIEAGVGGCHGCTTTARGPLTAGSYLGLMGPVFFYFNKTIFCVGRPKRPPPLSVSLVLVYRLVTSNTTINRHCGIRS
jgi:hypothetical protein